METCRYSVLYSTDVILKNVESLFGFDPAGIKFILLRGKERNQIIFRLTEQHGAIWQQTCSRMIHSRNCGRHEPVGRKTPILWRGRIIDDWSRSRMVCIALPNLIAHLTGNAQCHLNMCVRKNDHAIHARFRSQPPLFSRYRKTIHIVQQKDERYHVPIHEHHTPIGKQNHIYHNTALRHLFDLPPSRDPSGIKHHPDALGRGGSL